jgi:hypothetical protein
MQMGRDAEVGIGAGEEPGKKAERVSVRNLLFFPLRLTLSLLLSLCQFILLLGHLAFHLLPWAIGISVFLGGGGALADGILALFHVPDGSRLWIAGVMIGMWIIGPLVGGSFLHLSRPGRWLQHRWQGLTDVVQQKVDGAVAHITQAQTSLGGGKTQQKQADPLFESFDAALRIASAYGNVLTTLSPSQTYSSIAQLPVSKDVIRRSINLLYVMLGQAAIREYIKHWYPEQAEHLLSETFSQALRAGLADLPFFITDKEIALLTEMSAYGKEARAALQENRPCTFDTKQLAEKITTTPFIADITNIRTRILMERQQYLAELEHTQRVGVDFPDVSSTQRHGTEGRSDTAHPDRA